MPAYDIQDADLRGMSSSQLIVLYRQRGYSIREILGVMAIDAIIQEILLELSASGENAGYRQMRQRLLINHGLAATFEMVRLILGLIDSQGAADVHI
ncbi:hypothetical protein DPMN_165249 [Dreissena polymorpha]|uniref:Uncharacterized protein n=1 Tax=Dreissena polymorpha TaxID=45954 RepID=A0A9D4IWU1_DREPO|nr:hypothetical protein DPMN_165249 [Dreissena polymorpha]